MTARSFFDSNVLLYTDDPKQREKRERALDLFEQHRTARSAVVSTQVLQEYFSAATRKLKVDVETARKRVSYIAKLDVVLLEPTDILAAIDLHRLHSFSFWDALIVRAAKRAGCSVLLTEDMQHLREVEGLQIVNPFR